MNVTEEKEWEVECEFDAHTSHRDVLRPSCRPLHDHIPLVEPCRKIMSYEPLKLVPSLISHKFERSLLTDLGRIQDAGQLDSWPSRISFLKRGA